jgi:hypothetical protein
MAHYSNPKPGYHPPLEAWVLQALLLRREAIFPDLHRERNRQEKADATDTPALIHQSLEVAIAFLSKQLAQIKRILMHTSTSIRIFRKIGYRSEVFQQLARRGEQHTLFYSLPKFRFGGTVGGLSGARSGRTTIG